MHARPTGGATKALCARTLAARLAIAMPVALIYPLSALGDDPAGPPSVQAPGPLRRAGGAGGAGDANAPPAATGPAGTHDPTADAPQTQPADAGSNRFRSDHLLPGQMPAALQDARKVNRGGLSRAAAASQNHECNKPYPVHHVVVILC